MHLYNNSLALLRNSTFFRKHCFALLLTMSVSVPIFQSPLFSMYAYSFCHHASPCPCWVGVGEKLLASESQDHLGWRATLHINFSPVLEEPWAQQVKRQQSEERSCVSVQRSKEGGTEMIRRILETGTKRYAYNFIAFKGNYCSISYWLFVC